MLVETRATGSFLRRRKRFLVDLALESGEEVTVHCPNTGAMTGCLEHGAEAYCSRASNPKRKYPDTLDWLEFANGHRACINTQRPNYLVKEAVESGLIEPLQGYRTMLPEKKYGAEGSRIDWLLSDHSNARPECYVEVKNVTLCEGEKGYFPDAVSTRALKHLRELMRMVDQGYRAAVVFCVNHTAIRRLYPAKKVQLDYADLLAEARAAGVELMAYRSSISPDEIKLIAEVPIIL